MARQRIKKGVLEFSTNPERSKLIKRYVIGVRCAISNRMSHAYTILGIKKDEDGK